MQPDVAWALGSLCPFPFFSQSLVEPRREIRTVPPAFGAMKSFVLLASCLTLVSALFGKKSGSNPLALVTELLTKLKDQIVADGVKDEQVFVELQKWCASDKQEQEHSITDAQVEIDRTTALIESSQDHHAMFNHRRQRLTRGSWCFLK